jgi:hypothetical protein
MPVIAIGAAIGASVVAGSAVAAVGLTVVTGLEIVAAVGATIGAIGAVTGNKALSMAGTVIGAVGAIGGFAASAGLLGESAASNAPLFGPAPAAGTADAASSGTIDAIAGNAGDASASGLIDVPPAPPGGVGAVDPATGQVISEAVGSDIAPPSMGETITLASTSDNAADPAAALAKDLAPTGNDTTTAGIINSTPADSSGLLNADAAPGTPTPPQPPANLGAVDPTTGQVSTKGLDDAGKEISMPGSSGIFGGILDFAKKNPVATLGALQAGGSLLSGMSNTLTPAQVSALNAQAAANDAAAALTRQQTANLAMPKSVASSAPVTGAPAPIVPPGQPGLINRPAPAQVTGRAA